MQEQPIGPDTVPGPDLEYAQQRLAQVQSNAEKPDYSYSNLASDISGTVKEKVLNPVISGIQSANVNFLQKSGGELSDELGEYLTGGLKTKYPMKDDIDPPAEIPIEILKEDPVPVVKEAVDEAFEDVKEKTPQAIENVLKDFQLMKRN